VKVIPSTVASKVELAFKVVGATTLHVVGVAIGTGSGSDIAAALIDNDNGYH